MTQKQNTKPIYILLGVLTAIVALGVSLGLVFSGSDNEGAQSAPVEDDSELHFDALYSREGMGRFNPQEDHSNIHPKVLEVMNRLENCHAGWGHWGIKEDIDTVTCYFSPEAEGITVVGFSSPKEMRSAINATMDAPYIPDLYYAGDDYYVSIDEGEDEDEGEKFVQSHLTEAERYRFHPRLK